VYPPAGIGQLVTDKRMIAPAAPLDALSFNAGPPGVASEVSVEPGTSCELDAGGEAGGAEAEEAGGALDVVTPPDAAIEAGVEETGALGVGVAAPCEEVQPAATSADPAIRAASRELFTAFARAGTAQGTPSSRKWLPGARARRP
jgi:hypothetical protein